MHEHHHSEWPWWAKVIVAPFVLVDDVIQAIKHPKKGETPKTGPTDDVGTG